MFFVYLKARACVTCRSIIAKDKAKSSALSDEKYLTMKEIMHFVYLSTVLTQHMLPLCKYVFMFFEVFSAKYQTLT